MNKLQQVVFAEADFRELADYLRRRQPKKIFLVHGGSYNGLRISEVLPRLCEKLGVEIIPFTDFEPNPSYDSVVKGVILLKDSKADMLAAIGGGSAMDVAKCIKLFGNGDPAEDLLRQADVEIDLPFWVMPTTAGTGSEVTRFAVIYYNGEKISVQSDDFVPDFVVFDTSVLVKLPLYHRKATYLDALSHAIESYWARHSNEVSRVYASEAIRLLLATRHGVEYNNAHQDLQGLLLYASYLAGKAITITKTTAGHAMSYKLTSDFGLAHGQAAALCTARLWRFMAERGDIPTVLVGLGECFGVSDTFEALAIVENILSEWGMVQVFNNNESECKAKAQELSLAVNAERLNNHPIKLTAVEIAALYEKILQGEF